MGHIEVRLPGGLKFEACRKMKGEYIKICPGAPGIRDTQAASNCIHFTRFFNGS